MEDLQKQIDDFMQLVLRNLEKNGFPAKAVSFPLDKMFESASRRGFSFNKIRTLLEKQNIVSELTTDHVIFRAAQPAQMDHTEDFDFSNMASVAQKIMQELSPEQMAQLEQIMANLKPEDLTAIRQQWDTLPDAEKARMMAEMEKQNQTRSSPEET